MCPVLHYFKSQTALLHYFVTNFRQDISYPALRTQLDSQLAVFGGTQFTRNLQPGIETIVQALTCFLPGYSFEVFYLTLAPSLPFQIRRQSFNKKSSLLSPLALVVVSRTGQSEADVAVVRLALKTETQLCHGDFVEAEFQQHACVRCGESPVFLQDTENTYCTVQCQYAHTFNKQN